MPETLKSSCAENPGLAVPVIDRNRCEAKEDCVRVCPYGVFEIQPLRAEDKAGLSFIGRIRAFAHGNRQAYATKAEQCHGCGLCVQACPERAIKLRAASRPPRARVRGCGPEPPRPRTGPPGAARAAWPRPGPAPYPQA